MQVACTYCKGQVNTAARGREAVPSLPANLNRQEGATSKGKPRREKRYDMQHTAPTYCF